MDSLYFENYLQIWLQIELQGIKRIQSSLYVHNIVDSLAWR